MFAERDNLQVNANGKEHTTRNREKDQQQHKDYKLDPLALQTWIKETRREQPWSLVTARIL